MGRIASFSSHQLCLRGNPTNSRSRFQCCHFSGRRRRMLRREMIFGKPLAAHLERRGRVSGSRCRRRCRRRSGTGRSSTARSRTNNRYGRRGCFLDAVGLFFVGDDKRGPHYRSNPHVSRTCNDYLVTDFREILRIDPGTKIDSRCGENIGDTTSIPAQVHTDDTALCASFLSKICNLEEAIFRDRDCQRRSRNDFAPESTRKNKANI